VSHVTGASWEALEKALEEALAGARERDMQRIMVVAQTLFDHSPVLWRGRARK